MSVSYTVKVIAFSPDPERGEQLNVAVALFSSMGNFIRTDFDWRRMEAAFPQHKSAFSSVSDALRKLRNASSADLSNTLEEVLSTSLVCVRSTQDLTSDPKRTLLESAAKYLS